MRIGVVMLAFALVVPVNVAAQSVAPAPAGRHTFLPQHKAKLSIDFGAKAAAKKLQQLPTRCDGLEKRQHGLPPLSKGVVELPIYGAHDPIAAPAQPCPVR